RAVRERRLVARHVVAIPRLRQHHLHDSRAVTLRRCFCEILPVTARVHRASSEARKSVDDIKEHLLLVPKRDIAQLDHERRPPRQVLSDLQRPYNSQVSRTAEVFAEITRERRIERLERWRDIVLAPCLSLRISMRFRTPR